MQRILEDSTEPLLTYPPESVSGQASSASVRVQTPSTGLPDADTWDAATVSSVSASTNAAASAGADELSFAGDPSVVSGRRYLLDDGAGHAFEVEALATGTTVTLKEPLPMAMPSGATLTGVDITHALTATETRDAGGGLAKWKATIAGVEYKWDQQFRIVTQRFVLPLTGADLVLLRPEVRDLRNTADEDYSETLESAWETLLRPSLRSKGLLEARIKSAEDLRPALASACVLFLKRSAGRSFEDLEVAQRDYDSAVHAAIASSEFWYDAENTMAPKDDDGLRFNTLRVVR